MEKRCYSAFCSVHAYWLYWSDVLVKIRLKGMATIEAAIIMPLAMLVFVVSLHLLFYAHDQNVIGAVAYETVAVGSGREIHSEEALENYFYERVKGRTFLFGTVKAEVMMTEKKVTIVCEASREQLKIKMERMMNITEPEKHIRTIRKIR